VIAPKGGLRVGGVDYPEGAEVPNGATQYRQSLQTSARQHDPAYESDSAPNYGRPAVPHVATFQGRITGLARNYQFSDEALRDSVVNAHMMLNDPAIAGPLFARQMMVALLSWSIESENDKDPRLKSEAERLQRILERTKRFTEYRRYLLEAVWYGRTGIQNVWGKRVNPWDKRTEYYVRKWVPTSGDKILFRYDDGTGRYDPDQIGIKVTAGLNNPDYITGNRRVEPTGEGIAYFLEPWERSLFTVHKHFLRDGEYEDPYSAGSIHGVGLRNFLYWTWYQKQETLAQLVDVVDRTASGITIIRYAMGNPTAKSEAEQVAQNMGHLNTLTMPVDPTGLDTFGVDQIPANTQGIAALQDLLDDYYGDQITRFILGQTLSTKSQATGLGSGVADLQHDSLIQIATYDAINLEETLTDDLVTPLKNFNSPELRGAEFFCRISTQTTQPEKQLEAINSAWSMGAKIKTRDLMETVGLSMPDADDEFLQNPQFASMSASDPLGQQAQGMIDQNGGNGGNAGPSDAGPGFDSPGGPDENPDGPDAAGGLPGAGPGAGPDAGATAPTPEELRSMFGPVLNRKVGYVVKYGRDVIGRAAWSGARYTKHAPEGGITIAGKRFEGGQFITNEYVEAATPAEEAKLLDQAPSDSPASPPPGDKGGGKGSSAPDVSSLGPAAAELSQHAQTVGFDPARAAEVGGCVDDSVQPEEIKREAINDAKTQMSEGSADQAGDGGPGLDFSNETPNDPGEQPEEEAEDDVQPDEAGGEGESWAKDAFRTWGQTGRHGGHGDKPSWDSEEAGAPSDETGDETDDETDPQTLQGILEQMPVGDYPDGWRKDHHDAVGDIWTKGKAGHTNRQLANDTPLAAQMLVDHHAQQSKPKNAVLSADVTSIAAEFGLGEFGAKNPQRANMFVQHAAKALGHVPRGDTPEERAQDAAAHIAGKAPYLQSIEDLASMHGYKPPAGKNLATRAMGGAQHLVDAARKTGYSPQGNEQQQILGAFQHLEKQGGGAGSESPLMKILSKYLPGLKGGIKPAHIVGALFGFWLINSMAKKSRR